MSLGLTSPTPVLCGAGVVPVGLGRVRTTWTQLYSQLYSLGWKEMCKDELEEAREGAEHGRIRNLSDKPGTPVCAWVCTHMSEARLCLVVLVQSAWKGKVFCSPT